MLRSAWFVLALAACGKADTPPQPPAQVAKPLTGIWLGTLHAGSKELRVQIHLDLAAKPAGCTLDSLDQGTTGTPCRNVVASATSLSLDVPAIKSALTGTVANDGDTVTGTWTRGGAALPVVLTRQARAVEAVKIALDPAMPPIDIEQLQSVMDSDLAKLVAGELAPATGIGVTIGVVAHGQRKIWSYGTAKPDSVFEIGSITKTFTGLALAQMAQQHKVRVDEPVRLLLPKGTASAPEAGAEITLIELSAQRSGLPKLPGNMRSKDASNPYADYDAKALYTFVASHGVGMPAKPEFAYSNLGVGLLGQALADRAGSTYEALIQKEVTGPLGMGETSITLTPAMSKRLVAGHGANHAPARAWDHAALAGSGAIRSTANDMLAYLEAQLHPEAVRGASAEARTLPAAIAASHAIQGEAGGGMHIAFNWFHNDNSGAFWHNGATGGFSSFALFDPDKDFALIVLANRSSEDGTLADDLGKHLVQRLTGEARTVARAVIGCRVLAVQPSLAEPWFASRLNAA